ncbi:unnamed protein product [Camellia sinensis]
MPLFDLNDEFKWLKKYRLSERIRSLVYSYKLNPSDLDSISVFGSMISRPHVGFSHRESLEKCSEYVRRWLSGSLDFISEGSPTYSLLRDHVRMIVGSDYFTTPPPPPTHIEYQQQINFPWTLEEWLQINQSKILETAVLPGPNIQCTQWRLTQEVRAIIGGILKSFKSIHEQFYVCGQLNTENIMLSEGLDVKLIDVKLVRGNEASFKDDFSKLKEIIEKIIHNVAGNGNVPKDVLHFMSFLGKPMDRQDCQPFQPMRMNQEHTLVACTDTVLKQQVEQVVQLTNLYYKLTQNKTDVIQPSLYLECI